MKPLLWMRAIRDAELKRPTKRLAVLWALALRMEKDGTGFASGDTLANDAQVHRATVSRATRAERKTGYLVQTRRGHRLGDGTVIASEWQLTNPVDNETQCGTSATLTEVSMSQTANLNVANDGLNVADKASPRGLLQEDISKSARAASATRVEVVVPSLPECVKCHRPFARDTAVPADLICADCREQTT